MTEFGYQLPEGEDFDNLAIEVKVYSFHSKEGNGFGSGIFSAKIEHRDRLVDRLKAVMSFHIPTDSSPEYGIDVDFHQAIENCIEDEIELIKHPLHSSSLMKLKLHKLDEFELKSPHEYL